MKCAIGLIGLDVMGRNLALNMEDHGFSVAVFNRTLAKVDAFMADSPNKRFVGCHSVEELVASLESPRKIFLMVKAGQPVDDFMETLIPHLEPGDIIIDGGNSFFKDTERRTPYIESKGLLFVGTGVSGGEEGARRGPSMMPGGSPKAWDAVKPIFQAISAKVGANDEIPCCEWIGERGAGHYVKMVHNGIEYGDMQLICEAYWLLRNILRLSNAEIQQVFADWYRGDLNSYLIEITRDILTVADDRGQPGELVDYILDAAGAKGTGKWMSQDALDLGVPSTLVTEAVYARSLSAAKDARVRASQRLAGPDVPAFNGDKKQFIEDVRQALYASKICSYAQGYVQMQAAAKEYGWNLNYGQIALLWRGGCIIRAVFLQRIKDAFDRNSTLENLLLDDYFCGEVTKSQDAWRRVVATAVQFGVWAPAFTSALTYYDGYRSAKLPANLLQAQRDYFGAHTYKRTDCEGVFHTDWMSKRKIN